LLLVTTYPYVKLGDLNRLNEIIRWDVLVGRRAPSELQLLELGKYLEVENVDSYRGLLSIQDAILVKLDALALY
jgi:hypothetical protein